MIELMNGAHIQRPPLASEVIFLTSSAGMIGSLLSGVEEWTSGWCVVYSGRGFGPIETVSICWVVLFRSSANEVYGVADVRAPNFSHPIIAGKGIVRQGCEVQGNVHRISGAKMAFNFSSFLELSYESMV
jgi:hypothetical protein